MGTVEDIWQLALPKGSTLVAGEAGLSHDVICTARLRPRPPGFDVLEGGELAFVSRQSLRVLDENLDLATVIAHLGEMKVAAVAVLGEIDERTCRVADAIPLPLFALPAPTNLAEAEQLAMRVIVEWQADLYRRAQDAYRQLTDLAIEGRGLPAILERLAHITGKAAAMEDGVGRLRLFSAPHDSRLARPEASKLLQEHRPAADLWPPGKSLAASDPPVARMEFPGTPMARLVAPVMAKTSIAGYLSLIGESRRLGEVDRLAVARGAAACAIELARQHAALAAQDELQISVVDELLAGNATDWEAIRERALRLGFDLSLPHAAMVFGLAEPPAESGQADLLEALARELGRRRLKAPVRTRGESVSVLYPLAGQLTDVALKRLAEELRAAVATRLNESSLCVGVGRLHPGMEGLRQAHHEAEQALSLGSLVLGDGRAIFFADLGLYRLLFNLRQKEDLRGFHDEMLGKLIEYDARNRADLVSTLAAYFASRNSPTEAAERMHLHRNTFLYRLHRIREITGLDLDDPETRLALDLALHIGNALRAGEGLRPRPSLLRQGHISHKRARPTSSKALPPARAARFKEASRP